jgi:NhaP-type Na+/H+ or K+/H+ antiporter
MGAIAVAVVTATVFLWGLLAARLQRADLTAPIVFISVGALISATFGVPDVEAHDIKVLTEITLVWVLFSNASRVRFQDFRDDVGLYTRLLAVGLPLTIAAGWLLGGLLIPRCRHHDQPGGTEPDPSPPECRERPQRWHRHAGGADRHRRCH